MSRAPLAGSAAWYATWPHVFLSGFNVNFHRELPSIFVSNPAWEATVMYDLPGWNGTGRRVPPRATAEDWL